MSRGTNGSVSFTLEEFAFRGELIDLEIEVAYSVSPYRPMSMYGGPDNLGWPAEGGEVEDMEPTVKVARFFDTEGNELHGPQTAETLAELGKALEAHLDNDGFRSRVEERCLEDAADR